jgi:hypothetical protein
VTTVQTTEDVTVDLEVLDFDPGCGMHPSDIPACERPAVGAFRCRACGHGTPCSRSCLEVVMATSAMAHQSSRLLVCAHCMAEGEKLGDLFSWVPLPGGAR